MNNILLAIFLLNLHHISEISSQNQEPSLNKYGYQHIGNLRSKRSPTSDRDPTGGRGIGIQKTELTSWQLHLMSDLMVEITISKCPEVEPNVGRYLKAYIRDQVAKSSAKLSVTTEFFSLYSDLVACLHELNGNPAKRLKIGFISNAKDSDVKLNQGESLDEEFESAFQDFLSKHHVKKVNSTKTDKLKNLGQPEVMFENVPPILAESAMDMIVSIADSTAKLFKNMFDKNQTKIESKSIENKTTPDPPGIRKAKSKFSDVVRTMTLLTRNICPFSPSKEFQHTILSSEIGNQLFDRISQDQDDIFKKYEYFFELHNILDPIKNCLKNAMLQNSGR